MTDKKQCYDLDDVTDADAQDVLRTEQENANLDDFREKMEQDLDPGDMFHREPFSKITPDDEP